MRASKPITVTLGPLQGRVDARVASGAYGSASEVMRAALRALDREDALLEEALREKLRASLADPRPSVPAEEVFARARAVARGVKLGRKPKLTAHQQREALPRRSAGEPVREIARTYNVSHSTISRLAP